MPTSTYRGIQESLIMAMTPEEVENLALEHLPEDYLRRALKAIFAAHRVAWDFGHTNLAPTEAENLVPFYRRALLEGFLRDAAELVDGVEATVVIGDRFWNHTEVRSGIVVLTESAVPSPCALVEKAEFRLTLAQSAQMRFRLFDEPVDTDAPLYAILLHSRYQAPDRDDFIANRHLPGSAYLAFPSPDLGAYVHSINLFTRFPDIVAAEVPQEWDAEAHVRYLNRARKASAA